MVHALLGATFSLGPSMGTIPQFPTSYNMQQGHAVTAGALTAHRKAVINPGHNNISYSQHLVVSSNVDKVTCLRQQQFKGKATHNPG